MALTKVTSGVRTLGTGEVTAANIASGVVDTSGLEDDVALLGFKVASNGSLAKYNLVDQTVDDFQDTSGVNASSSTNEIRDSTGKYYAGAVSVQVALTTVESANWTSPADVLVASDLKVLAVAGGGASGQGGWTSAGAGAGGLVYVSNYTLAASQAYGYTVGAGGVNPGASYTEGTSGANSVWDTAGVHQTLTATGGGFGGVYTTTAAAGGSGGGGAHAAGGSSTQAASFGSYTGVGFGYAGGTGNIGGTGRPSAGGGGAGSVGANYAGTTVSGNGGAGKDYSAIFGASVGDQGWFAGGGGGGGTGSASFGYGNGGDSNYGGGGDGGASGDTAVAGTANTGGGGGANTNDQVGKDGGSGVIILIYNTLANLTLVSTTTAAQAAPTKGDIVFTYTNGAGSTTLGTDVTAEISADGGSTWTAMTLGSEGSTGSHNIATAHDVTITSTITSPWNMAYRIKTLNQAAGKSTRIQAVSLGWS